jgi:hypothetical protein
MKILALSIGLLIAAMGVVAVASPDALGAIVGALITPGGLYVVAAFRVAVGIVLLRAASASRTPLILGTLGAVILVSGLITPLFGVERARAVFEWWAGQPGIVMRTWGAIVVLLGAFVAYSVGAGRRGS